MSKNILAFDLGYGSVKVGYKTPTGQLRYQKLLTAVGKVEQNEALDIYNKLETNVYMYENTPYYLGLPALFLPSKQLIEIDNYKALRFVSPIIISYYLDQIGNNEGIKFDTIVVGLSLAHATESADYKRYLESKLNVNIRVLAQGVSSKFAIEKFGLDPTDKTQATQVKITDYIGMDLGFNTVDVFSVIRGKSSFNTSKGYEGQGVIKVAEKLRNYVAQQHKIDLSIQDYKNILEDGALSYRGLDINLSEKIHEYMVEYLIETIECVETDFAAAINKVNRVIMVGGGANLIKRYLELEDSKLQTYLSSKYSGDFLMIPKLPEFYNVLGYYTKEETDPQS